jgi:hypothetical protein
MDFKVSRKETRIQPDGPVDVLVSNIFDLYPVFAGTGEDSNVIVDVEVLDGERPELLDRAMFALVKQRGLDPTEPRDGIQWSEAVIGEVSSPVIIQQVHLAVAEEGPGVRVTPATVRNNGHENLVFRVELTNAV